MHASRSLRKELVSHAVRVLVVEPGPMSAPMLRRWLEQRGHTLDVADDVESGFSLSGRRRHLIEPRRCPTAEAHRPEVRVENPESAIPSPSLFQQIIEGMAEAVIVSDRNGMIVFWNQAAEAMFGYSAAEAAGQSLDLIIPERFRARHWAGYRAVMSSGVTRYGRELLAVPAIRKDKRRISLEFSIVLIRGDGGALVGAAAIVRDVTARWERERATRTSGG